MGPRRKCRLKDNLVLFHPFAHLTEERNLIYPDQHNKKLRDITEEKISVFILNYNLETLLPDKKINPVASIMFTLLAEFSRLERETLRDRIVSGLDTARKKGVKLGRPKGSIKSVQTIQSKYSRVLADLNSGLSLRTISKLRGISVNTIQKVKGMAKK